LGDVGPLDAIAGFEKNLRLVTSKTWGISLTDVVSQLVRGFKPLVTACDKHILKLG
jgi:hypothetical protein